MFVKAQGYDQGHSDHTLFTKKSSSGKTSVLIVYVDDIVLTSDDTDEIMRLKTKMAEEFEIKDLGNYDTLAEYNAKLSNVNNGAPVSKERYQRLVRKLIYLSHTRPDISYTGTPGKSLLFRKSSKHGVEAYTDSDWAGSAVDRKSVSGYCTFV
ncbi:uncharacterized mitochondrial protein AtMg00810-like [Benincasa hispida]|uniref:uncharacterized mitochondrial protein AtMg00810-like n=1 Tax=Benincasa hispida TaxID=102211 RepID=UPI0019015592|nr:uncharacterized mitochondrial protein AtMg00810-like [Benincasa hispida]